MIICCGEALIDMIPAPTTSGQNGFVPHVGGAVFNTAIALGRLGADVAMLTGMSRDLFGQQLEAALTESRVDTQLIVHADRPTTLAFVQLTDGQAQYVFYDENSAGRGLSADDLPDLPDEAQALFFGGISLCNNPAADSYVDYAERAAAAGRTVVVDPNIRPGFITDEPSYRARLDRLIACADIVKISGEDLDWIYADEAAEMTKAERLCDAGPTIVVLTKGAEGAVALRSGAAPLAVPSQRAKVMDTVAAGDTFNAGFLAKLDSFDALAKAGLPGLDEPTLRAALEHGARAAAVTVSRSGANPPWAAELEGQ